MKDAYLTKRLLQGDTEALCQVYHEYKHDLLTVAMSLLCRTDLAEDCVHDVFTQFASGLDHIEVTQNLKGYLMRCVANRAKNLLKQQHVRRTADPMPLSDHTDSPVGHLIGTEQSMQVFTALAKLPDTQREVITLHLHGQMTFRDIGLHLGISTNTVQSRYRYGIEKLRTIL